MSRVANGDKIDLKCVVPAIIEDVIVDPSAYTVDQPSGIST